MTPIEGLGSNGKGHSVVHMHTDTICRTMGIFADRLREALDLRDVSQSELQRRLAGQGFDAGYSTIQNWYHGQSEPTLRYVRAVAEALDVAPGYLLGTTDDVDQHHRPPPGVDLRSEVAEELDDLIRRAEELRRRLR